MSRTIVHIGAGKCGSSALQRSLTRRPRWTSRRGERFEYLAIGAEGQVVKDHTAAELGVFRYAASVPLAWVKDPVVLADGLRSDRKPNVSRVLSCEGWIEEAATFASTGFFERIGGEVTVVMYVRPQVPWINSAWWQWGAWTDAPFARWLGHVTSMADWNARADAWKAVPGVSRLEVRLVGSDIVSDFARLLDSELEQPGATNVSLDAAVLRLFQRNRRLRPGPHDSAIDFILGERLPPPVAPETPWVVPHDVAEALVAGYRESNLALERHLDAESWQVMRDDPRWWTTAAFGDRRVQDSAPPEGPPTPEEEVAVRAVEAVASLHRELVDLRRREMLGKRRPGSRK